MELEAFRQLGASLLLGFLVGLQREHAASGMVGLRTFPLITVLGTVSAILATAFGGWIVAAALLGLVAVLALSSLHEFNEDAPDPHTTTSVAALLMFAVGALLVVGPLQVAVAVGGGVAILLQLKPELHGLAGRLGDRDLKAIMQFVLITCIILPVLPNKTYAPLEVLNPFETWLMVVLIVGMSLGGYIVYKFLGRDAGVFLGGVLGGAISSTATTISYARMARGGPIAVWSAAIVVMIASTVVYLRVLIEMAVVSRGFLASAAAPIVILMLLTLAPSLLVWFRVRRHSGQMPEQENPTQLKSAVMFGLMYALVRFGLAAAGEWELLGGRGFYVVAGLSGLTDMDAVTLSTAQMFADGAIRDAGWRLIVVAALANLVFKTAIAGVIGGWRLLGQLALLLSIPMVGGIGLLWLW